MLKDEDIEAVKSQVNMVMVAEHYGLRVNRKGYGLCPFHSDSNPSMQVFAGYLENDGYYCWSCGVGGTIFDFIMNYEDRTFEESVRVLADAFCVQITDGDYSPTIRDRAEISHRKALQKAESLRMDCKTQTLSALSERIHLYEEITRTAKPFGALFAYAANKLPVLKYEWEHQFETMCDAKKGVG